MRRSILAVTARAVLSSLPMVVLAVPAYAVETAPSAKDSGGWISIVAMIVLLLAVAVGSFLSPRRSHLD